MPLDSPPLLKRREDIAILANHFIESYCRENGTRKKQISTEAMDALTSYSWLGNIRELKNMIERLMIMCSAEVIDASHLPNQIHSSDSQIPLSLDSGLTLKELRDRVERDYIEDALKRNGWNISQTAKALDVDRTNLHKKIKQFGLSERNRE